MYGMGRCEISAAQLSYCQRTRRWHWENFWQVSGGPVLDENFHNHIDEPVGTPLVPATYY